MDGMTDAQKIEFLMRQLAGAVTMLRQSDERNAGLIEQMKRYDARRAGVYKDKKKLVERQATELRIQLAQAHQDASRYRFLRQHQVQVWKLGIATQGETLDKLVDAKLEQQPVTS